MLAPPCFLPCAKFVVSRPTCRRLLPSPSPRRLCVCASSSELRQRLTRLEVELVGVQKSAATQLERARTASAQVTAAQQAAQAAVLSGDDAAALTALTAKREHGETLAAALTSAKAHANLSAKLEQTIRLLELDIIAAEAPSRTSDLPAAARAAPSPSSLSEDELAERFLALEEGASSTNVGLEAQLRRAMRARAADDLTS